MKILRLVTSSDAVRFHLRNTLVLADGSYEIVVVGTNVEEYKSIYPKIRFINLRIERKINPIQDIWSLVQLMSLYLKEKPDIVHSIMPKAGFLSSLAGFVTRVPVRIHTFTGQTWANASGAKRSLLILMDKITVFLNTVCMTDSPSQSDFLLHNGISDHGSPLKVLGSGSLSGVDLNVFDRSKISADRTEGRLQLNISTNDIVFIYLGRKCEDKGLIELVNAFVKVNVVFSSSKLLLVGPDEASSNELKNILKNPPAHVINQSATATPEVMLNLADVFCIPSHREGFGTVVIEAAALGLPTIGTRIPGLQDSIIENETGLLVNLKNESQLSETMLRLCHDTELRKFLSENAKRNAWKNYDSRSLEKMLSSLYKDLLNGATF